MTVATKSLEKLLADCEAHSIRLTFADGGGLEIDAPRAALTPDLLARLKTHKTDLLAMLRPAPEVAPPAATADIPSTWSDYQDSIAAAIQHAFDNPSSREDIGPLWMTAPGGWPAPPVATRGAPAKPAKPGCRCGGTTWRDVPIHGGRSVRRDCGRCGRFLEWQQWNPPPEQKE